MSEVSSRLSKGDRYTPLPLLVLLPLLMGAAFLLIFEPGGALGSPQFWLAIIIVALSTLIWLGVLLVIVFCRMWRRALSMLLAEFISLAAMGLCISFSDQIHFQIMRPFYLREVAQSNAARMEWPWRGGLGFDNRLVFDRSDQSSGSQIRAETERKIDNCKLSTRIMGEHFYLESMTC
jgi:hypothetical protein